MSEFGEYPDAVVITGAGRGIGRSIALDVAKESFVLCVSQSERALATAESIREAGGRAEGLVLDLEDCESAETAMREWVSRSTYRRIGAVFAGGILGPQGPLGSSDLKEWERTFRINVFGNLAVARALLPVQVANGFGRLLFFGGGGAAYAYPMFPAYAASKAALVRIVENLHEDLPASGNFATAILAPGAIETDMLAQVKAMGAEVRTTVPIEEPTAFARAFLSSSACGFSGRFVHVRDDWKQYLNGGGVIENRDLWKLRRVE